MDGVKINHYQKRIDVYKSSVYSSTRKLADRFKDRDFDPQDRTERLAKLFYKEILNLNN